MVAATKTVDLTALKLLGISGTGKNVLAIINNHSFSAGDEGDVITQSGKIHIRCLEINQNSVLVEVDSQVHKLNLESQ